MFFSASLSIFGTCFNKKNADKKHISNLYNLLIGCSVFLSWTVIYIFDFSFEPAILNLFIILMVSTTLSPSVIYPGIAFGGLTITTLSSVVFFREHQNNIHRIGLGVGVVALIFLNI